MYRKFLLACLLGIQMPVTLAAADLETLLVDCDGCHGPDGISTDSDIPIIAGQSAFVMEDAMHAYADEMRPCAETEYRHGDTSREPKTMCEIAAQLSEDDIIALSEHYAGLPFVAASQPFDAGLVARGAEIHDRHCEKCHSEGGSLPDDDAGILAGQWMPFLRNAIDEYMAGTRPMSEKMAEKMERVDAQDFDALLHYYASLGQ